MSEEYDLVLLDIAMPGRNGFDIFEDLTSHKPHLPVLFLSMFPEQQYAIRALRMGASGYLTKTSLPDELAAAITKVVAGGKYLSASLAEKLVDQLGGNAAQPLYHTLSNREIEILRLIASGKKTRQIADQLFLSLSTIYTYRARILKKLRLENDAELIRYAIDNQLA